MNRWLKIIGILIIIIIIIILIIEFFSGLIFLFNFILIFIWIYFLLIFDFLSIQFFYWSIDHFIFKIPRNIYNSGFRLIFCLWKFQISKLKYRNQKLF